MIPLALLLIIVIVTVCVASDGPVSAGMTFLSVLLSGLIAMNFFEPLANFLGANFFASYEWQNRWDIIALLGLFAASVTGLRLLGEWLFPTYAQVSDLFYEPARWVFGLATGYLTMAILLTSLHVAPLPRSFRGFQPEADNLFGIAAPDRQWLAFTQYVSEYSLSRRKADGTVPIFDGAMYPAIPSDLSTNRVWSSFPIRYAARREQYTTGKNQIELPGLQSSERGGTAPAPSPASSF
ncbi:CvpA family protein [Thalassoglobus neptunius]|nr:CvpA family protein [Thalassoglobus neptunius]